MTSVVGVPVPTMGSGASGGGVKRSRGNLSGSGFRERSFGGESVLGYLSGNTGRHCCPVGCARLMPGQAEILM